MKSRLTGKDPDDGKDWSQEKGTTEDEKVGWHHRLNSLRKRQELAMDREAWRAAVPEVAKSQTQLNDWTELNDLLDDFNFLPWSCTMLFVNSKDLKSRTVVSCSSHYRRPWEHSLLAPHRHQPINCIYSKYMDIYTNYIYWAATNKLHIFHLLP